MVLRVLLFVILSFKLLAQQFSAASFLGSGGAAAAQCGVFSLQDNPSGITAVHTATVASAYQQHFGSSGVATQALFAVVPVGARYRLGFLAVNYGVRNVSSFLRGGLSFVRSFGGSLSTSISANYHQFFVQHYESQRQFTVDLGLQYRFASPISVGIFWRNIANSRFSTLVDQRLVSEIGAGVLLSFTDELELVSDIWHQAPRDWQYRGGLVYTFDPKFILRAGILSDPMRYTAGAGFRAKRWKIDLASSFHTFLGSSPQLSMAYAF